MYHMSYCSVSHELQHTQVDDRSGEVSRANYAAFWINKKSVNIAPMESCQVQSIFCYHSDVL